MPILTPLFSANTAANNQVVAGVAGQLIRVVGYFLVAAGAVVVTFTDGAGGTALTGAMTMAAGIPLDPPMADWAHQPVNYWFKTSVLGNGLFLTMSAAVQVSGHVIVDQWSPAS